MLIIIVMLGGLLLLTLDRQANNNLKGSNQIKIMAQTLYLHICDFLTCNHSWSQLLGAIEKDTSLCKNIQINEVYWVSKDDNDLMYIATKDMANKFSLYISGSANGTSKNLFGFTLHVSSIDTCWLISIGDSMAGFKPTTMARELSIAFKDLLVQNDRMCAVDDNGKLIRVN